MSYGRDVDVELSTADRELAGEVLRRTRGSVISWRELVDLCKQRGTSLHRLRKVVAYLVSAGYLIELKCRVFTTREYIESRRVEELVEEIREKVHRTELKNAVDPLLRNHPV